MVGWNFYPLGGLKGLSLIRAIYFLLLFRPRTVIYDGNDIHFTFTKISYDASKNSFPPFDYCTGKCDYILTFHYILHKNYSHQVPLTQGPAALVHLGYSWIKN